MLFKFVSLKKLNLGSNISQKTLKIPVNKNFMHLLILIYFVFNKKYLPMKLKMPDVKISKKQL